MTNERKIEVLELVKEDISTGNSMFICNSIKSILNWSDESYEIVKWFQSTKKNMPKRFKDENWEGNRDWWNCLGREIRVSYLEYLINKLKK